MYHSISKAMSRVSRKRTIGQRRKWLMFASILSCLLCLWACSSMNDQTTLQQATPTPVPPAKGTVLFQSDWSQQHSLWQISAGWQQTSDYLQSDVNTQLKLTIPYTPTTSNYIVEFRLQVVDVPKSGGYFQLAAPNTAHEDGYRAYVSPLLVAGDHMDAAEDIHDYDPTSSWRTYQVVITGADVSFFVDNHRLSYALSSHTQTLARGPLQFTCTGAILRLGKIRILAG